MDQTGVPEWPARVGREDARAQKDREARFRSALKSSAKANGWGFAGGGLFRREADWFVDVSSTLLWGRGVRVALAAKPMAVDPVFWSVVGLPENARMPLSFRSSGAWVLRSPRNEADLALGEAEPQRLAEEVVDWSASRLPEARSRTVPDLLRDIRDQGELRKRYAALEVCLHLLLDDLDGAFALCLNRDPADPGGFTTGDHTFFDQARAWIIAARRARIRSV